MGAQGFTLVEVLVAAACLTAVVLMTSTLSVTSYRKLVDDGRFTEALQIGSSVMENLLSRDPTDPLLAVGQHALFFDAYGNQVTANAVFTAAWTIVPNSPVANVSSIQEVVQWSTAGFPRQISLSSSVSAL